ncbi:binding [Zea mays]|uniref:Binding n=1 Tax=Zea mays TaxID=4577 RepID=A0A1D6LZ63_MAIZE|nr:binding [Zea mays]
MPSSALAASPPSAAARTSAATAASPMCRRSRVPDRAAPVPSSALAVDPPSATTVNSSSCTSRFPHHEFFPKLVDLFRMCENSRNMDHLHMIFRLVKGIILLNDAGIFDKIFSDDFILDIIGALEYDPEVPSVQSHREFVKNQTLNEAIHIGNVSVVSKIRQTYIVGYIKDVILLNALDGPTLSSLNSIIERNKPFVSVSTLQVFTCFKPKFSFAN